MSARDIIEKMERKDDYPRPRPTAPFYSTVGNTGSMRPWLNGGERIYVTKVPIEQLKTREKDGRGDLVIMWYEARKIDIIHELFSATRMGSHWRLITKGMNNSDRDAHYWDENDYIGRAVVIPSPGTHPENAPNFGGPATAQPQAKASAQQPVRQPPQRPQ